MDVEFGKSIPPNTKWNLIDSNKIELNSENELIPSNEELEVSLVLANPGISPPESINRWRISCYSSKNVMENVNNEITGFRVFAEFESTELVGRVLAPNKVNTVGISFSLASDLTRNNKNPSSYFQIEFPNGYRPIDSVCGRTQFQVQYVRYDGADSQFNTEKSFVAIPSGSICSSALDDGKLIITVNIDAPLLFGVNYAFQIGVVNPTHTPTENALTFKTLLDGVVLHLRKNVHGLILQELNRVDIVASNPTRNSRSNIIKFTIQSTKTIPSGSTISIGFPIGFLLTCDGVEYHGLGPTSQCSFSKTGSIEISTDTAATAIEAGSVFAINVLTVNPPTTPQINSWSVTITNLDGVTIDVRTDIPGFDVSGQVVGSIASRFVYTNQRSLVTVRFTPSTIQTRAIDGNQLVLIAPQGYVFSSNCQSFSLKAISSPVPSYPVTEPDLIKGVRDCRGYNNETLIVTFDKGFGLHRFEYELKVVTVNAKNTNADTKWTIMTRSPDLLTGAVHTMDYNSSIPGYSLVQLNN